jgi:Na+/H+ antiporter NhaD/arsenite permease-like protein
VVVLLVSRTLDPLPAFTAINWNVMGIFCGTYIIAELFIYSKAPSRLADSLVERSKNAAMALVLVCGLSGFISAFCENVAVVMIVAPIAMVIARRLKVSPVPFLIGISISSNLQGAATLVGDPPSMLLASYSGMTFNDFFFLRGRPSLFFAVELAAAASLIVLYAVFRKFRQPVTSMEREQVLSLFPSGLLIGMVMCLAAASFLFPDFPYGTGSVCMLSGIVGIVWFERRSARGTFKLLERFDWDTFFLLTGIFILVEALSETGIITDLAGVLSRISRDNSFLAYTILTWISVALSAFVDNVPYVTAMLPVAGTLAASMSMPPYLLLFGILIGASIGGNITPIGSAANIVAFGVLKRAGEKVSFIDFVKIGLPFTVVSVLVAYAFIWIFWR